MFDLNPYGNSNAPWQHIIMIAVTACLGFLAAYMPGKKKVREMEQKLKRISSELESYQ